MLGQFNNVKSFYHNIDPRSKIFFALLFSVSVFFVNNLWMFTVPIAFLVYQFIASKQKIEKFLKGVERLIVPFVILSAIVYFSTGNSEVAVCTFLRLLLIVLQSSVLTSSTTPSDIANGINKVVKNDDLAMIFCIALRYLPILVDNANKLYISQKNRGADFENKSLKEKVKLSLSIIVPLFVSSFRTASNLGTAMDARLYGKMKRSSLNELKFTGYDLTFFFLIIAYILLIVEVRYVC